MIEIATKSERAGAGHLVALMRLATWATSAVGVGIAIAAAGGDARVVRCVAVVAAGIMVAVASRFSGEGRVTAGLAAGLAVAVPAGVADALVGHPTGGAVLGALLLAFVVLGSRLVHGLLGDHEWPAATVDLPLAADLPALDLDDVAVEVNRARRYERPLSVLSLDLSGLDESYLGRRRAAAELVRSLSMCLRQSDLVGYRGRSRILVVLPETRAEDASRLVGRLRSLLDPEMASVVGVGVASFPEEELTWVGLEGLAVSREAPIERWAGASERTLAAIDGEGRRHARATS